MPTYIYDKATDRMIEVEAGPRPRSRFPSIHRDLPAYRSPLGTGWIEGRAARREDMKRGGVREVDPSEKPQRAAEPDWVKGWRANRGIERSKPNE